jgi:hypothetical protein
MHRSQRGVSLIEAVVALAVMAFGMLALVGVQTTLRSSGDLGRQRTEAVRIAQETLENYRAYAAMAGTAGTVDFGEIVALDRAAVETEGTFLADRLNTTFFRTVTVAESGGDSPPQKSVRVTIDWTDRAGQFQAVQLGSFIAGLPPELAGALVIPPARSPSAAPGGRNQTIPLLAKALPNTGTSVFKPPQGAGGTVAWVFNNTTGLITGICTVAAGSTTETLTAADVAGCSNNTAAQLISGFVRFANGVPTVAEAELPSGGTLNLDVVLSLTSLYPSPPVCFDDSVDDAGVAATRRAVSYYCLMYSNAAGTFAGRARIRPLGFGVAAPWTIADVGAGNYKVCRYTPLDADAGPRNIDHPLDYTAAGSRPKASLTNQNFLVIAAVDNCPTEVPAAGDYFNSNTRLHQNGSATYDNP